MTVPQKYEFGSRSWWAMQESESTNAAWPAGLRISIVERYRDVVLANGMHAGFRLDVDGTQTAFRFGVSATETGDVTIDLTSSAGNEMVHLLTTDPTYEEALSRLMEAGDFVLTGSIEAIGDATAKIHDAVSRQTL